MAKFIITQSQAKAIPPNIKPNASITGSVADLNRFLSDKIITSNKNKKQ